MLSRSFCSISSYVVSYDLDGGDFITFNSNTKKFVVQTDDNKYGDLTYTITITGETVLGFHSTISFTFNTIKMCGNVELTSSSFVDPIYFYSTTAIAESFTLDNFTQVANVHATEHCDTVYEV